VKPLRPLVPLLVVFALAGCQQSPPPDAKPLVIASFYPMYDFARQVAGNRAEVVSLMPPGVHGHDWEPSPQDVARLQRARVFVYNGAGFEPWAEKMIAEAAKPSMVVVAASTGLARARSAGSGEVDPHVWLDPVLAQGEVEAIRGALERGDPAGKAVYDENARAFQAKLAALHQRFEAGLRDCARRDVVMSHSAFGYLTRRYRLEQVSVMGLSPESEPSPATLANVVRLARQRKVKAIFVEPLVGPRLAETLARELDAQVLPLNPIEGVTAQEAAAGKGYTELMVQNLESLRAGLGCK
jgi:zinc transport system substrate-binding protein